MSESVPPTENLGVVPMPSKEAHMAVLRDIQGDAGFGSPEAADSTFGPPEPVAARASAAEPVSLTAYKAVHGPAADAAAKALQLAKTAGVSPQFAADNAELLQRQADLSGFEDMLGSSPVLAAYAGQSGVHASAVKDDVGPLEALEQGLMDVGYQEWATAQMSFPTGAGEQILRNYETETAVFDQRPSGIVADFARSAPSLAAYYLAGILGRRLGGKPGEIGATAGLMYGLNRGALYRRILQNAPNADQLALQYTEEHPGEDVSDEKYAAFVREGQDFEKKARVYATVGATASAALGAGLSSAVSLAVPGAARKIQTLSTEIIARAFADETTRAVAEKLAAAGGHTLAGALYMAVPAVVDDATVQKAVTGEIDFGKALETGWDAFKKSLLAAGVLSTAPHVVPIVRDFARARQAPAEVARLDHLVEQAQASKLRQRSPAEFEQVAGKMAAQGDASTVHVDGEAAQRPEVAQRLVEALADEGQALAEAQATGTDVVVPMEKYLSVLGDQHQALREDVKLSADGATLRQAQEVLNGPVAKLLAERTVLDQQPDSPEKRAALQDLHERMRDVVASQYRADPQEYAKAFTDQAQKMLAAAAAPSPAVGASLPADAEAWARKLANEKTIADLRPGRYELAARRAEDKLAAIATQSAEKGQEAARQAFVGAGAQAQEGAAPEAGKVNLRQAGSKADAAARKLADVPRLERARDLARAQAKVHEEVQAEMQKASDYLAKRDTDKYRAELGKASPEYLEAFNTLQEAIDENTPRAAPNPLALDALLARMDSDAEPVAFDADQLRAVLEQPRGWRGLTPPEARTVFDAVKNIRTAARRQNELTLADRKATLREFVSGLREYLDSRGTPDSGLPAPSRASEGVLDKAAKTLDAVHVEQLQPLRILRDRLGEAGNAIADAYVKARNAKEMFARDVGDYLYKAYEVDLPKALKKTRFDGVKGPGSPAFNDNLWTRQDLWELASWWGSESGAERIKRGLRITDSQAHDALSQLTNAEADFLDAKWKLNDEKLWPLVRDHTREVTGVAPPKIEARPFTIRTAEGDIRELRGGYEPARYRTDAESTATAPTEAQSIADYWGTLRDGFDSTAKYFTKERAQTTARVPDLNWSMYAGHVNSVLHYLAYDDFVRNTGRVFRDTEFRELVQHRLGAQEMTELDKFLGLAARGFLDSTQDGAANLNRLIGTGLRGRYALAAFQLNPRIVLGQLSHIPAAMWGAGIGPIDMTKGVAQALRPWTWGDDAHGLSQQLAYRWNGYGAKMREQLANIGPGDKPYSRKWLDAAGWSLYHAMDGFLSKSIYEAAYAKTEGAGADAAAAARAGDHAVELMMPPLNLAEQSSVVRDRGAIGSLLLVRNFPNTLYNVGAMKAWQARNKVWAADPGWERAKVALGAGTAAAAAYLGVTLSAHIFGRFLMGHGRQRDETTAQWLEREAIAAPFYPVPFGSEVVGPIAESAVTHKTLKQTIALHGLSAAPAIEELERAIKDLGSVVGSKGSAEDRVFAGLRLAANTLRLPSEPLKGIRYGYDLAAGNVQPRGPFDVAGGFFYGQRPRQPKNPATVTQDFLSGD